MSYTEKRHARDFVRKNNYKHIRRKELILMSWGDNVVQEVTKGEVHRLSKGKVHCSCPMCQEKTRIQGWKHSDAVKLSKGYDF